MTLTEIAEELYGLPPEEFTAARDSRAKQAAESGDQALAKNVRALRRPKLGAWLLNMLVRERSEQLGALLELGAALRQAQESLAGDDLKRLSRQRRQVIQALAQQARGLAAHRGHRVSEDVEREIAGTLEAALADADAAAAVHTGRLLRPLHANGLDPVDLTDAVAAPTAPGASRPPRTAPAPATPDEATAQAEERRKARLADAEVAVREARERAAQVHEQLSTHEEELVKAALHHEQTRARAVELEAALAQARDEQAQAEAELRRRQDARDQAASREGAVQRQLAEAEAALQRVHQE